MATPHDVQVSVGDQVYLEDGGDEIGAVRRVARDHLVIYIEGAGDFTIQGPAVRAAHAGKIVLEPANLDAKVLEAARLAHEGETE